MDSSRYLVLHICLNVLIQLGWVRVSGLAEPVPSVNGEGKRTAQILMDHPPHYAWLEFVNWDRLPQRRTHLFSLSFWSFWCFGQCREQTHCFWKLMSTDITWQCPRSTESEPWSCWNLSRPEHLDWLLHDTLQPFFGMTAREIEGLEGPFISAIPSQVDILGAQDRTSSYPPFLTPQHLCPKSPWAYSELLDHVYTSKQKRNELCPAQLAQDRSRARKYSQCGFSVTKQEHPWAHRKSSQNRCVDIQRFGRILGAVGNGGDTSDPGYLQKSCSSIASQTHYLSQSVKHLLPNSCMYPSGLAKIPLHWVLSFWKLLCRTAGSASTSVLLESQSFSFL